MTSYPTIQYNLTAYGGPEEGFLLDSAFQEVNITTGPYISRRWVLPRFYSSHLGEALFTWLASDHVSPSACYNPIGSTGTSLDNTWDYFVSGSQILSSGSWTSVHNPCQQHINSIDLSDDGNYLISSRHCYTLYFINGTTGEIIWQMGGANSSFTMEDGTNYSWQHHARWITKNDTYATITSVSYPFWGTISN